MLYLDLLFSPINVVICSEEYFWSVINNFLEYFFFTISDKPSNIYEERRDSNSQEKTKNEHTKI